MLQRLHTLILCAICLLSSSAQADPSAVAAYLADGQIQTHLAFKQYSLAESYLNNSAPDNAQAAYTQALDAARNALAAVESALADIQASQDTASAASADDLDTAIARITVANSDLLQAIEMLEAKSAAPESGQPTLGNALSSVTTELINATLYASLAANR